ncbi:hypothetical protein FRB90_011362 [Tulasnella sp. 427]|nr:hypothetical protein FRB90_011362 [Tulasnella sp. 427]
MDQVERFGYPLSRTNTFYRPPGDPGLLMTLKWTDNAQECFMKFQPYVAWLRDFVQGNAWVPPTFLEEYDEFMSDYSTQETLHADFSAVHELFTRGGHSNVGRLWKTYRALRKRMDDMGTSRVSQKAAERQTKLARYMLLKEDTGHIGDSSVGQAFVSDSVDQPEAGPSPTSLSVAVAA